MKRSAPVVVALVAVVATLTWLVSRHYAQPPAVVASPPEPSAQTAPEPTADASAERIDAGRAGLDPLDCETPLGDVARIDGEAISATELCTAWRRVAGAAELSDPTVLARQGRTLLDSMIDARLVHRALASAGREVAESEVDTAFDELLARQHASSREAFEQTLRAQGSDVPEVRAELRRRLERARLLEQRKAIEPAPLLEELRAKAKIEYLKW